MRFLPFIAFIAVPVLELTILIKVGEIIGVGATIALVISTAVIGVSLLKRQGLAALARARDTVEEGEFPVESIVDGACLLVAGAFLITPGLLTDTAGFSLLIPGLRRRLARWLFAKLTASGQVRTERSGSGPGAAQPSQDGASPRQGPVIEGEYEDIGGDAEGEEKEEGSASKDNGSPWRP